MISSCKSHKDPSKEHQHSLPTTCSATTYLRGITDFAATHVLARHHLSAARRDSRQFLNRRGGQVCCNLMDFAREYVGVVDEALIISDEGHSEITIRSCIDVDVLPGGG